MTCKLASCSVQSDVERVLAHTCLAGPWNWFQLNIQGLCLPRPVFFFFLISLSFFFMLIIECRQ